eukprot:gnl/TRDRNA2_/TRDRNA2_44154_c0_seq2.p2 gnl/TRDRNA2_/TRDRNA2_44154_c0~~gnl/TRDRNA2_/TRDRNA2_44154_c0_seq2.p2  ORF type:complete len:170 (+),score=25.86 gnl/TRDRNA2_/TRDRNA2_44154_c0_seq2:61-510(+)
MPAAGTRLYVGNLNKDRPVDVRDLEDYFSKYGRIVDVWVARQPPGFAFVTMDDERDAKDAVNALDGSKFQGERIRCEISRGGDKKGGGGGGRGGGRDRSRSGGRGRGRSRSRSGGRNRSRSGGGRGRGRGKSSSRSRSASRSRRRRSPS